MPLCGVFGLGDLRDDRHVDGGSGEREVGELSAHRVSAVAGHQPGPPPVGAVSLRDGVSDSAYEYARRDRAGARSATASLVCQKTIKNTYVYTV